MRWCFMLTLLQKPSCSVFNQLPANNLGKTCWTLAHMWDAQNNLLVSAFDQQCHLIMLQPCGGVKQWVEDLCVSPFFFWSWLSNKISKRERDIKEPGVWTELAVKTFVSYIQCVDADPHLFSGDTPSKRQHVMLKYLSPCYPCAVPRCSFWILISAWYNLSHCGHLRNEAESRFVCSLSCSFN